MSGITPTLCVRHDPIREFNSVSNEITPLLGLIKGACECLINPSLDPMEIQNARTIIRSLFIQLRSEPLFSILPTCLQNSTDELEIAYFFLSKLRNTDASLVDKLIEIAAGPSTTESTLLEIVPRSTIDSDDTYTIKKHLNDLYRFQEALNSAGGILKSTKYIHVLEAMPENLKASICELVWMVHGRPEGDMNFGQNKIIESALVFSKIKNQEGKLFLSQYIQRLESSLLLSKAVDQLEHCKESIALGRGFPYSIIPEDLQNSLKGTIWDRERKEAGQENNPQFGGIGFGDKKLKEDPEVLLRQSGLYKSTSILDHFILEKKRQLQEAPWELQKIIRDPKRVDTKVLRLTHITDAVAKPKIMMVAMEFKGYASEGGLAEALEGLSKGLQAEGYEVKVLLPYYRGDKFPRSTEENPILRSEYRVVKKRISEVDCYLIDPIDQTKQFSIPASSTIYGQDQESSPKIRFARFSLLAADYCDDLWKRQETDQDKIDVIHIHDSQPALAARLLKESQNAVKPPVVFTIHNNGYSAQVKYTAQQTQALKAANLPSTSTNALVEGFTYSDAVTTVSHTFGREAQSYGEQGKWVGNDFRKANTEGKFFTIVNGITTSNWDPNVNQVLKGLNLNYSATSTPEEIQAKKMGCKAELQQRLRELGIGSIDIRKPLLFYVGRFDPSQKGIDKMPFIIKATLQAGGQFICIGLGAEGCKKEMEDIEKAIEECKKSGLHGAILIKDYKDQDGKIYYQVKKGLGPVLRSAADIGVFPSIFEPCGLVQGETFVTGARVIATDCGGFSDTVTTSGENKNGWVFKRENNWNSSEQEENIKNAIVEAIEETKNTLYSGDESKITRYHEQTKKIMERGLRMSWNDPHEDVGGLSPAQQFGKVYEYARRKSSMQLEARQQIPTFPFDIDDPAYRGF